MPDILTLGPFHLKTSLVVLLLSCIAGFLAMKLRLRNTPYRHSLILDLISNGLIIVFLFWKLGPALSAPSILWKEPLKLLIMTGSSFEVALGSLAAAIYILLQLRKLQISLVLMLDLLAYAVVPASLLYRLLQPQYGTATQLPWGIAQEGTNTFYHPVHLYFVILLIPIVGKLLFTSYRVGEGRVMKEVLLYYGVGALVASYFTVNEPFIFYLSLEQLGYVAMALCGILISKPFLKRIDFYVITHNINRKELIELAADRNDSKAQAKQEQENKARQGQSLDTNQDGNFDKKLDGPNQPST